MTLGSIQSKAMTTFAGTIRTYPVRSSKWKIYHLNFDSTIPLDARLVPTPTIATAFFRRSCCKTTPKWCLPISVYEGWWEAIAGHQEGCLRQNGSLVLGYSLVASMHCTNRHRASSGRLRTWKTSLVDHWQRPRRLQHIRSQTVLRGSSPRKIRETQSERTRRISQNMGKPCIWLIIITIKMAIKIICDCKQIFRDILTTNIYSLDRNSCTHSQMYRNMTCSRGM